jgi:hypothetical protein
MRPDNKSDILLSREWAAEIIDKSCCNTGGVCDIRCLLSRVRPAVWNALGMAGVRVYLRDRYVPFIKAISGGR